MLSFSNDPEKLARYVESVVYKLEKKLADQKAVTIAAQRDKFEALHRSGTDQSIAEKQQQQQLAKTQQDLLAAQQERATFRWGYITYKGQVNMRGLIGEYMVFSINCQQFTIGEYGLLHL